jgi:hypothetical protein
VSSFHNDLPKQQKIIAFPQLAKQQLYHDVSLSSLLWYLKEMVTLDNKKMVLTTPFVAK